MRTYHGGFIAAKPLWPFYLSFLMACQNNPASIEENLALYPLKKGNFWEYSVTPSISDSVVVESISSDAIISNERWFFLSRPVGNRQRGDFYRNGRDGVWILRLSSSLESRLLYKYPVSKDDSYVGLDSTDTVRVVATAEDTSVPAGIFSCIVYQRKFLLTVDSTTVMQYVNTYISPSVGKVKEETFYYGQGDQRMILSEYALLQYSLMQ